MYDGSAYLDKIVGYTLKMIKMRLYQGWIRLYQDQVEIILGQDKIVSERR